MRGLDYKISNHLRARDAQGNYVTDDSKLLNYLKDPGVVPSVMVLGEIERRQVEAKQSQAAQAQTPQGTVKDQMLAAASQPTGINGLGVAMPPGAENMPNPETPQMSPEERAGTGIAVMARNGGYIPKLAGGGIVAFAGNDGSLVGSTDPSARPFTEGQNVGLANVDGYTEAEIRANKARVALGLPPLPPMVGPRKPKPKFGEGALRALNLANQEDTALSEEELFKQEVDAIKAAREESKPKQTEPTPLTEQKPETQNIVEPSSENFTGAKMNTGSLDTSIYDQLAIEDPAEFAAERLRARKEALGEDPYKDILKTEKAEAEKDIAKADKDVLSNALLSTGLGMLQRGGKGEDIFTALGGAAQDPLKQAALDKKEVRAMKKELRSFEKEIKLAERKEKEAAYEFGVNSEQYARANNMKVKLQQQQDNLKTQEMEMERPLKKAQAEYYSGYGQYLKTQGFDRDTVSKIESHIDKNFPASARDDLAMYEGMIKDKQAKNEKPSEFAVREYNKLTERANKVRAEAEALYGPYRVGGNRSGGLGEISSTEDSLAAFQNRGFGIAPQPPR
jgi:hypothetical protein